MSRKHSLISHHYLFGLLVLPAVERDRFLLPAAAAVLLPRRLRRQVVGAQVGQAGRLLGGVVVTLKVTTKRIDVTVSDPY